MAKTSAHFWLAEPLLRCKGLVRKRMFGADSLYLEGKLILVLADGDPDWDGLLFPTEYDQQAGLQQQFPCLVQHKILRKWLFLSAQRDDFEIRAHELVRCLREGDARFGVIPQERIPRKNGPVTRQRTAAADGRPPHLA